MCGYIHVDVPTSSSCTSLSICIRKPTVTSIVTNSRTNAALLMMRSGVVIQREVSDS